MASIPSVQRLAYTGDPAAAAEVARRAVAEVQAYNKFLGAAGVRHAENFFRLPQTDKASYCLRYP